MSWKKFEEERPELAAFGKQRFEEKQVAYLATIKKDGSPRLHPVTPIIGEGHLFLFMEPTSPKGNDLRRDGRYALHSAVEDASGAGGEFLITGRAKLVEDGEKRALAVKAASYTPADRYLLFEFGVEGAMSSVYRGTSTVREKWEAAA